MLYINTKLSYDKKLKDSANPEQLRLWIIATHSDIPINMRLYLQDEMKKSVSTWVTPYQKPVLRHHDEMSDQIGRVVDQFYIDKETWNGQIKQLIGKNVKLPDGATGGLLIKAYITDQEQIQKILAGNYTTVSVGFSANTMICNICKKPKQPNFGMFGEADLDPNQDEICEHITGSEYDGVIQYDVPLGLEYKEISFVNEPADSYAGIAKIEQVALDEALSEVKNEFNDYNNVNSKIELIDSNREEAGKMDEELIKLQDEINKKDAELVNLKDAYQKLLDDHTKLLDFLKDDYTERVAGLKAIVLGIDDDNEINNMKLSLSTHSLDTLKALELEYKQLVQKLLENEDSEDKECVECATEPEKTETVESKDEEQAEQNVEPQQQAAINTNDSVNLQKEQNPADFNMYDPSDIIDMLLGIKK